MEHLRSSPRSAAAVTASYAHLLDEKDVTAVSDPGETEDVYVARGPSQHSDGTATHSNVEVDEVSFLSGDSGSDGDLYHYDGAEDKNEEGGQPASDAPVTSTLSEALQHDLQTTQDVAREVQENGAKAPKKKDTTCCVCGNAALYTCPGCQRRTCSMTCVRVHKQDFHCSGERDVAAKVTLSDFTDQQLERDFRFLEDCRRVVDNVERCFPRSAWRFNYKALPPPLHALREAARRRGVICQITSEGMHKRGVNTSRLDRKTNTVVWRCEFQFHDVAADGTATVETISTDWGSERHHLGDVLKYCWATNPPLFCYHINRQYNRASKYVGGAAAAETKQPSLVPEAMAAAKLEEFGADEVKGTEAEGEVNRSTMKQSVDGVAVSSESQPAADETESVEQHDRTTSPASDDVVGEPHPEHIEAGDVATTDAAVLTASMTEDEAPLPFLHVHEEVPPMPHIEPVSEEQRLQQTFVNAFLTAEAYVILSKAERLGSETKYFRLSPYKTLNENLRLLFFVNEFPVFIVVHASQLSHFPLVAEADKEAIRSSFRSKRAQEVRERPPPRRRSEMEPEDLQRLAKVPCRRFLQHKCQLGDDCPYWHCTPEEIPVCRAYLKTGQCDKGRRCSFRHDPEAVRVARKRQREERDGGVEGGASEASRAGMRGRGCGRGGHWRGSGGRGGGGGGGSGRGFRGPGAPRRRFD